MARACLIAMVILLLALPILTFAKDQVISPLIAGTNAEYDFAGLYYGTLPKSNPQSRRVEFRKLLAEMNIRVIRFPGGTPAITQYLADNADLMRSVIGAAGYPEGDPKKFTNLWDFLDFCKETGITPIYQINTALYCNGTSIYQIAGPEKWFKPAIIRDTSKRADAAEALTAFVKKVRDRGFVVKNWELGNEEYGVGVDARDYADIATRFTKAIHKADPKAMVWITLGSNHASESDRKYLTIWSEALLDELKKAGMTHEKNLGFTLHYVWPEYIDVHTKMVKRYSFKPRFAVTEFHMAGGGPYWDLSPRYKYMLDLSQYLISMVTLPEVEILCIHEMTSQNFGIFHYNQHSYGPPGMETWDASLGYQSMPSAYAYKLFGNLIGGVIQNKISDANRLVVQQAKERRVFLVNPTANPVSIQWDQNITGKNAMRYECRTIIPNLNTDQTTIPIDPLSVDRITQQEQSGKIIDGNLKATIPPYSINYIRCYE